MTICAVAAHGQNQVEPEQNPLRGLRILETVKDGPAQRAGLEFMDLLSRYGDFEIVDYASYFAAREVYDKSPGDHVRIVVWRGHDKIVQVVPSGDPGMRTNEYNPVCYQFEAIVGKVNGRAGIPSYMRDREFKEVFAVPADKLLDEARSLIDQGEQEHKLTPAQVLISRIYLILDDAAPEQLKKQKEMLDQLVSTQPNNFIEWLGKDFFFAKRRYRSAVECFKHLLALDPTNVSARLYLARAYFHLQMWNEAGLAADSLLRNSEVLDGKSLAIAQKVQVAAALGRGDFSRSIDLAEKYFPQKYDGTYLLMAQLAAAESGDLNKFQEISHIFEQKLPDRYRMQSYVTDAMEAHLLVKNNQRERARALVLRWNLMDRFVGKVAFFLEEHTNNGADVAQTMKDLMRH